MEKAVQNATGDESKKGPGRPPKYGAPMTAAQRQRAYRERVRRGSNREAISDPRLASRPELLRQLAVCLSSLDSDFDALDERWVAQRILAELTVRYELEIVTRD